MLDELATCGCTACDSALTDAECQIVYDTPGGRRRVYECGCGAVTVTLSASPTEA